MLTTFSMSVISDEKFLLDRLLMCDLIKLPAGGIEMELIKLRNTVNA